METTVESSITTFQYAGKEPVRTSVIEGKIWFVAQDVCRILGISKYRDAVNSLDEDERASVIVDTLGGRQSMTAVSESGLYTLVMQSRKRMAQAFRKWVTATVLPALRTEGTYSIPSVQVPAVPTTMYGIIRSLVDDLERQDQAIAEVRQRVDKIAQGIPALPVPESAALEYVTPTQIGRMFSPRMSGIETNKRLQFAGLQYRVGGEWVPSDKGKDYVKTLPVQLENGKCVYQLHWQRRVYDMISEVSL